MGSRRCRTPLSAAVLCAALGLAAAPAARAQGWTLVDLGTLGGSESHGAAVSDSGVAVGCADTATGVHAFVYRDGAMQDLGTATDPASGNSCALAVNESGVVAGRSGTGEIVLWGPSGITHLGVQGNVGGIDDAGTVVGAYGQGSATHAFVYRDGKLTDIGGAAGSSAATAINVRGQVAGTADGHAFLYDSGSLRELGTLGGGRSSAAGIDDRGDVVGMAFDAASQPLAFVFDGTMHALAGAPSYSGAVAINNRGQVVGSGEGVYGYVVDNGQSTQLSKLPAVTAKGWTHLEPSGINDRGWIVGTGTDANRNLRAFLLIPDEQRATARLLPSRGVSIGRPFGMQFGGGR
jgi:probable HAF family extracellular repeat protein